MRTQLICPKCGDSQWLEDPSSATAPVRCHACRTIIPIPATPEELPLDVPAVEFGGRVGKYEKALRLRDWWQKAIPETHSSYRPSGTLPWLALLLMILGSTVGAALGAVATLIGVAFALIVTWLIMLVVAIMVAQGGFGGHVLCVFVIVPFVIYAGAFVVGGMMIGEFTTAFGRWGKNRNVWSAALLSGLAGMASGLMVLIVIEFVCNLSVMEKRFNIGPQWHGIDWVHFGFIAIGALLTVSFAIYIAIQKVHEAKFCEDCERFMSESELKKVGADELGTLATVLLSRDFSSAATLLDAPDGEAGLLTLHSCPGCSGGYIELTANFKADWWEGERHKELHESWLAASIAIPAGSAEMFRAQVEEQ